MISEPVFSRLAAKFWKTNVQIILRRHIQKGNIVIPESINQQHMKDNFNISDFELSESEMQKILKLDQSRRFSKMTLEEQEKHLSGFKPAD